MCFAPEPAVQHPSAKPLHAPAVPASPTQSKA
jgi:hypothetical protein